MKRVYLAAFALLFCAGIVCAEEDETPLPRAFGGLSLDMTEEYVRGTISTFGLAEDAAPRVRETVGAWLAEVPPDLLEREVGPLDLQGLVEVDRANAWAGQTVRLLQRLGADLQFDDEKQARARRHSFVFIPLKRPPE